MSADPRAAGKPSASCSSCRATAVALSFHAASGRGVKGGTPRGWSMGHCAEHVGSARSWTNGPILSLLPMPDRLVAEVRALQARRRPLVDAFLRAGDVGGLDGFIRPSPP